MKVKDFIFVFIIGILVGVTCYLYFSRREIIKNYPVWVDKKVDTIWIEKVKSIKEKAKLDTIIIRDTIKTNLFDTLLIAEKYYSDSLLNLFVKYYFPPTNEFEINYKVRYPEVIKYKVIEDKINFGIGLGVGLFYIDNKFQIKPNLNFSIYYKVR